MGLISCAAPGLLLLEHAAEVPFLRFVKSPDERRKQPPWRSHPCILLTPKTPKDPREFWGSFGGYLGAT